MARGPSHRAWLLLLSLLALVGCGGGTETRPHPEVDAGTDAEGMPDAPIEMDAGCPPGSYPDGGACVIDAKCSSAPCGPHGTCDDTSGSAVCTCEKGWAGATCASCDTAGGYHDDGKGQCTSDPCMPNPCMSPDRVCVAGDGGSLCVCKPGTHDDGGACMPDTTCLPTTCSGHGTCAESDGKTVCTCEPGWSGTACAQCDDVNGYHPDGNGGCTTDPCLPSPCTAPHQTVCTAAGGNPTCACDPGYHDQGGTCIIDETCTPTSCSGHGACSVQSGHVACACDPGFSGAACASCDTAGGYHDDGNGGCTNDPCLPSPCTVPNKTACVAQGTAYVCQCIAGYHDDGAGGCTNDPCVPNLCLAMNQACQVVGGMAQCYTPNCNDGNPCTTDALVGGNCQHTPLANGTSCQTSLCKTGEACQSGVCAGGAPLVCNDGNPCTDDTCDPMQGCVSVPNDANVPSDGIGCTIDTCSNGFAAHAPSNAACDDGLWCTGTEVCQPGQPDADAQGCRHTNVPQPPASSGACSSYGACSEATHSFPQVFAPNGTSCNDGIPCTSGDVCNGQGACQGTAGTGCSGGGACSSTHPGDGNVDIPVGVVLGTITLGGAPLPTTNTDYDGADIYLVAKDTGAAHLIGGYSYQYQSANVYSLRTGTYGGKVIAGIYDVLYRRYWNGTTNNTVSRTLPTETHVAGYRILQSGVVIGTGTTTLDVDIPVATVTGTITLGGSPLPATNTDYDGADIYLVAKDTGAAHLIGGYSYQYQSANVYALRTGTYGGKVPAGVYDVLYRRYWNGTTNNTVSRTLPTETHVAGYRILQTNLNVPAGATTLNVDIPVATVTGTITLGGAPLPATNTDYDGADIYLVAKDTGAAHLIGGYSYQYQSANVYALRTGTYGGKVPAGLYDVLYRRYWNGTTNNTVSRTLPTETHVAGYRVLQTNLNVPAGATTLNVDIPVATVTGTITLAGAALPATNTDYDGADIYLVAKDTGAAHLIGGYSYQYQSANVYALRTGTYGGKVPAGVYDVLYRRYWNGTTNNTVSRTLPTETHVAGYRILQTNLNVPAGATTLNIDIPVATVTGTITLAGAALPATNTDYDGADIYLVAKDTGAAHLIGGYSYQYQSANVYTLRTGTYGGKVPAGVYDVLYRRYWNGTTNNTVSRTLPTETHVAGYRILQSNLNVPAGATTLNINIPVATVTGTITLAGAALPATNTDYDGGDIYLVAKDTGAAHLIGGYSYQYQSANVYALRTGTYGGKVPVGVYDVQYRRYWNGSTNNTVSRTLPMATHVAGYRLLDQCMATP
ncbi:Thiamin-phosphate pyrophosphorylase [Minicystis rosea]|nr:Thiamin-phosphate pyrophosphorylase [Minicystis rosea]